MSVRLRSAIMVSSRRSLRAVIGGAANLVSSNPAHTKEGSRPTAAELIRVKRHKFPDAHRRPAGQARARQGEAIDLRPCPSYRPGMDRSPQPRGMLLLQADRVIE